MGFGVGDGVTVGVAVAGVMGDGVMVAFALSAELSIVAIGSVVAVFVGAMVGVGNSNSAAFSGAATVGNNGDDCTGTAIARNGSGKREA